MHVVVFFACLHLLSAPCSSRHPRSGSFYFPQYINDVFFVAVSPFDCLANVVRLKFPRCDRLSIFSICFAVFASFRSSSSVVLLSPTSTSRFIFSPGFEACEKAKDERDHRGHGDVQLQPAEQSAAGEEARA
jgi:hypothetical protein